MTIVTSVYGLGPDLVVFSLSRVVRKGQTMSDCLHVAV